MFAKLTAAAALVAAAMSASAMTTVSDDELSAVSGQDGVSIIANLNLNIGSFQYTDTSTGGGSVSFDTITVKGMFGMTIDILGATSAVGEISAPVASGGWGASAGTIAGLTAVIGTSDVVRFGFPAGVIAHADTASINVAAIKMGNSANSFGSLAINNFDLGGTTVYMLAH